MTSDNPRPGKVQAYAVDVKIGGQLAPLVRRRNRGQGHV